MIASMMGETECLSEEGVQAEVEEAIESDRGTDRDTEANPRGALAT